MSEIRVQTENKEYPILITEGFAGLKRAAETAGFGKTLKLCIITDDNVGPLYGGMVKEVLAPVFGEIFVFTFPAGESHKTMDTILSFYDFFLENKLDRKSVIMGLGGGVCGDMAGFAAATYLRGISFIQVPTTLLAQVDSSVGGKVGIDYRGGKNIIGAFYQPEFVYINLDTLQTLPKREFNAGMAEVIKYGPIGSEEFYSYIQTNREGAKALDRDVMAHIIQVCCEIKADVVAQDERESGLREILNFGHTIGHAIESVKNFSLLHGECVALGMTAVLFICKERGIVGEAFLEEFIHLLQNFDLPVKIGDIDEESVYTQMFLDKKVRNNKIGFVLIEKMGRAYSTKDLTEEEIRRGIRFVIG